jgi:diguanylate cyclase (GGDEF)-like protein
VGARYRHVTPRPSRTDGAARLPWLVGLVVPRTDQGDEQLRHGRLAGVLYLVSALFALLVVTQVPAHRQFQLMLAGLIAVSGAAFLVVPWDRVAAWVLHIPIGLAFGLLSIGQGALLGDLDHWGPAYPLAFAYIGLVLGPLRCTCWGLIALAGLAGAALLGNQHEDNPELAAAITISALMGELVAVAVAVQRRHGDELKRLHTSLAGLLTADDLKTAVDHISREAADLLQADGVTVLMRENPGSSVFAGEGGWGLGGTGYRDIRIDIGAERTATRKAVLDAEVLFIPDVSKDALFSKRWAERLNVGSVLYLPFLGRDEVIGVMPIWWTRPMRSLDSFAEQVTLLLSVQAAPVLERLRQLEDLDRATLTDPLTGVGNRRAYERALAELPGEAALIICDLDRFKGLNDTHGHAAGDRVLRHFASAAIASARSGDLVCRIGGDEFALVVRGGREAVDAVLGRLEAHWASPDGVGFSAGSAVRRHGEDGAALSERADLALYDVKRIRGGRSTPA